MKEVLADIERWRSRGDANVALATVVATRGSAPRPLGSKLAVSERGELAGSVSGGCVESDVALQAREILETGEPRLLSYGIADELAWSVGLPCGGEIDVFVERHPLAHFRPSSPSATDGRRLAPKSISFDALLAELATGTRTAVVYTIVSGDGLGAKMLKDEAGTAVTNLVDGPTGGFLDSVAAGATELLHAGRNRLLEVDDRKVFAEVYGPPPRLLIYGAVDTAEALCALARPLGWHTIVADGRAAFATPARIPSAHELIVGWPDEVLDRVDPDYATAIVVLTHDDKFDVPLLKAALETEALYIGALGSRRNQARRRERLEDEGVAAEALDRIRGPAGLDLGASTPAETALSILAEVIAVRAGREGGSLRRAKGRIHAATE